MRILWLFGGILFGVISAFGQEADTIQLGEVLVSAKSETPKDKPYPTVQTPLQAMDVLASIPGVVRAQQSAFPISYRGQHGSRLRVQQNGARKVGLNPQGYLGQDLNPANLQVARMVTGIEKVVYGSGAIGGVLLLEDVDATEKVPSELFFNYGTNNRSRRIGGNWQGILKNATLRFSGSGLNAGNFHFANLEEAQNSKQEEYNFSSAVSTRVGDLQLNWRQNISSGSWQFPQGFQNNAFELRDLDNHYTYQTDLKVKRLLKGGWSMTHQLWGLTLKTDQTQDQYNALFESVNFKILRSYTRSSLGYNGGLERTSNRLALKAGIDLFGSVLEEHREENDFVNDWFTREQAARRNDHQGGTYFRVTTLNKDIQWTGALRLDLANTNNLESQASNYSAISGGIQATWSFLGLDHQVHLGRFFRFPRPEETGGELFGGRGVFRGNPDIKPEYSHQLEWALSKQLKNVSFRASTWFTHFLDRIVETPVEQNVFLYDNVDQARTYGLEWTCTYTVIQDQKQELSGNLSGLVMGGDDLPNKQIFGNGQRSIGIPPSNMGLIVRYSRYLRQMVMINVAMDASHIWPFEAPEGFSNQVWAVRDAPAYTLLGANLGFRFIQDNHDILIDFGVSNLADVDYFPFGTRVMGMGRNIRFGAKYAF